MTGCVGVGERRVNEARRLAPQPADHETTHHMNGRLRWPARAPRSPRRPLRWCTTTKPPGSSDSGRTPARVEHRRQHRPVGAEHRPAALPEQPGRRPRRRPPRWRPPRSARRSSAPSARPRSAYGVTVWTQRALDEVTTRATSQYAQQRHQPLRLLRGRARRAGGRGRRRPRPCGSAPCAWRSTTSARVGLRRSRAAASVSRSRAVGQPVQRLVVRHPRARRRSRGWGRSRTRRRRRPPTPPSSGRPCGPPRRRTPGPAAAARAGRRSRSPRAPPGRRRPGAASSGSSLPLGNDQSS